MASYERQKKKSNEEGCKGWSKKEGSGKERHDEGRRSETTHRESGFEVISENLQGALMFTRDKDGAMTERMTVLGDQVHQDFDGVRTNELSFPVDDVDWNGNDDP